MRRSRIKKYTLAVFGIILAIFWISPFYLVLDNSFKTKKELFTSTIGLPKKIQLGNYRQAAVDLGLGESFVNTILITALSILIIIIFSSMSAYALQRVKRKTSTFLFIFFTAAMLIPFQAVMIPLVAEFGKVKMLNIPGLIFMYLGFGCSLGIFLYHGALKGIPQSLDDAARIDGCGRFRTFWLIVFPMLKPTTVTIIVLDIMWIWNDYLLPSLVVNKQGMRTLQLMIFYFFGQYTRQWHLALAGLTIAILPVLIFYFLVQKQIVKGIISGAVKQ
ncbi:MAG: carbohydrate ABC transporter permease [Bacillota bacterium]|nr:carbohydrate ABC transporter permease [Bacillota bacterium]